MEIQFPFLREKIIGRVQYVASEVSKDTHAIKVRASIPNPNGRLKSDMLVKAMLEIPPKEGQTVVPRRALLTSNGLEYVFVRVPNSANDSTKGGDGKPIDKLERRRVTVAQESHDEVVIAHGLTTGEMVVENGSLIVAQLYDDTSTATRGKVPE